MRVYDIFIISHEVVKDLGVRWMMIYQHHLKSVFLEKRAPNLNRLLLCACFLIINLTAILVTFIVLSPRKYAI